LQPPFPVRVVDSRHRPAIVALTLAGLVFCGLAAPRRSSFSSIRPLSAEEFSISWREAPADLMGNEVRPAVALYQVDADGEIYEEHSPETEVVRLAPPEG
jgi:hypothetical protein